MKIFYITANNGDGSSRTEFYDSQECIDFLTDAGRWLEAYMDGDGGSWGSFEAPGGIQFDNQWQKVETMADLIAQFCDEEEDD